MCRGRAMGGLQATFCRRPQEAVAKGGRRPAGHCRWCALSSLFKDWARLGGRQVVAAVLETGPLDSEALGMLLFVCDVENFGSGKLNGVIAPPFFPRRTSWPCRWMSSSSRYNPSGSSWRAFQFWILRRAPRWLRHGVVGLMWEQPIQLSSASTEGLKNRRRRRWFARGLRQR